MAMLEVVATGEFDPKKFGGEGRKQAAAVLPNKDWTTAKWSTKGNDGDAVSYTEIIYPLSCLYGRRTPAARTAKTGHSMRRCKHHRPILSPRSLPSRGRWRTPTSSLG